MECVNLPLLHKYTKFVYVDLILHDSQPTFTQDLAQSILPHDESPLYRELSYFNSADGMTQIRSTTVFDFQRVSRLKFAMAYDHVD